MKRKLAMRLVLMLVLSLLPVQVFASETVPAETAAAVEETVTAQIVAVAEETTPEETEAVVEDVVAAEAANAVTESGSSSDGKITWVLEDGVLTISGSGDMENYSYRAPWYISRSNIRSVIIEEGVTSIGRNAFYNCISLADVTIPDSITSIGNSAFEGCTSLTGVTISGSVTSIGESAFEGCGLTDVTIPGSVTYLGDAAFSCNKLSSITFLGSAPENISAAFISNVSIAAYYPANDSTWTRWIRESCSGITWIMFGTCGDNVIWTQDENGVLTISGSGDMENYSEYSGGPWRSDAYSIRSVIIEEGVTSIGDFAFYQCSSLTDVTIPNSVTSIGSGAFYECVSLPSVTIPNSVTTIGDDAFYNCINLTSVTIPDSVTSIGAAAFRTCGSLTNVTIPGNVTSIGTEAFVGCPLTSVKIPGSVTYIGAFAFNGCGNLKGIWVDAENLYYSSDESGVLFDHEKTELIQAPGAISGSYSIPDSVAVVGESAFQHCNNLTDIKIPKSVTHIGEFAFSYCDGLTSVAMPNSITIIREYAFYECDNLTKVTIPNSLTKIYKWVFAGCDRLTSVIIPDSVKTIGYCAFSDCNSLSDVYYGGYKYQWNTIYVDAENECLTDAEIHYDGIKSYMHVYDVPEFIWDTDYSCDAYFTCISCGEVQIVECMVKSVTTAATCIQNGETEYTAEVVLNAEAYTDKKTVTINALGHSYDGSWDATCNNCGAVREVVVLTTPMYRLYNPNSGEHFYTGSIEERDNLKTAGWLYEGVAWNAPTNNGTPVYRLFNPNNGDHHYTMSAEERDMLVGVGWQYEGVAWNSATPDNLPLYRLYNPNADCGSHHYTGSEEERDNLVEVGWHYEGIGWYGMLH